MSEKQCPLELRFGLDRKTLYRKLRQNGALGADP